jgi:hypothetical protein
VPPKDVVQKESFGGFQDETIGGMDEYVLPTRQSEPDTFEGFVSSDEAAVNPTVALMGENDAPAASDGAYGVAVSAQHAVEPTALPPLPGEAADDGYLETNGDEGDSDIVISAVPRDAYSNADLVPGQANLSGVDGGSKDPDDAGGDADSRWWAGGMAKADINAAVLSAGVGAFLVRKSRSADQGTHLVHSIIFMCRTVHA